MTQIGKTKKDKLLSKLENLANTVQIPDVKLIVAETENYPLRSFEENEGRYSEYQSQPRVTLNNKFELAEQVKKG